MKKVYLAGPIHNQTDEVCNGWRSIFHKEKDFIWLDPMRRDYRGKEVIHTVDIVEKDKEDINNSDAIVAKCDPIGIGTSMEIIFAYTLGIPVISIMTPAPGKIIHPWIAYHSAYVVESEAEALQILRNKC